VIPARPAHSCRQQRGSALLAALCFATILAIALSSYITVCYRNLSMSSRGMQNTRSIELAEMGMEDALWALNETTWTGWTITGTTATKTVSGFSFDNGATGSIGITITNYDGTTGTRTIAVSGTVTGSDGKTYTRSLTSASAQAPLFTNAVAATNGTVSFASAGTVDSYDSSVGTYDPATAGYSAILASAQTAPAAANITLVNAQVKGYAATLYGNGPSYSTSAKLIGPTTPGTTKIDLNRISTSPYQPVFSIKTITGAGDTLVNPVANVTLGSATDTTPHVYYSSGINMTGTTKVTIAGPVRIVMSGNFYIGLSGGTPSFEVQSTGSLEVFTNSDIAIYGNGINNLSKDPKKVAIYGTNALTAPDMSTPTAYYGVIYTPDGSFTVRGDTAQVYGAIVAKKVSFAGATPGMHYDLNLRNVVFSGIDTPYAVSGVRETTTSAD